MISYDKSHLRGDIVGGITAGVVALPLALALGVASGLGPIAGMYGAIAVGFFAALFGGTPSQISGPTGPMVVVLAGLFASLSGNAELVFTAVMLAGVIQIAFGLFGVGQYIRLVPYPVVSGFMSGIGVIIIILQLLPLLGYDPGPEVVKPKGTVENLQALPTAFLSLNPVTVMLGLATLAIAYYWPPKLGRYLPGALSALLIGSLVGLMLPRIPVLGDIPTGLPSLHLPTFDSDTLWLVLEAAVVLAILGSIDSLLTSLVADNMTRTRHNSNKELIGQGIGNTVAGLIGGIAGAGATMRTVVNIRSGGKDRVSGMTHALLLLAIVLGLSPLASQIPMAVLAGILVKVGLDIIDWRYLTKAHKGPRWDLLLMALVLFVTVFVDLIQAVALGVFLAALAYVRQVAQIQLKAITDMAPQTPLSEREQEVINQGGNKLRLLDLDGPLSFGAAADLGHHVRHLTSVNNVIVVNLERVPSLDVSAALALETIIHDATHAKKWVYLSGLNDATRQVSESIINEQAYQACEIVETREEALEAALKKLQVVKSSVSSATK